MLWNQWWKCCCDLDWCQSVMQRNIVKTRMCLKALTLNMRWKEPLLIRFNLLWLRSIKSSHCMSLNISGSTSVSSLWERSISLIRVVVWKEFRLSSFIKLWEAWNSLRNRMPLSRYASICVNLLPERFSTFSWDTREKIDRGSSFSSLCDKLSVVTEIRSLKSALPISLNLLYDKSRWLSFLLARNKLRSSLLSLL